MIKLGNLDDFIGQIKCFVSKTTVGIKSGF